jgi:hypothetical protein
MGSEIDISYTTFDEDHYPVEHYESHDEFDIAIARFKELVNTVPATLIVMSQLSKN